MRSAVRDLWVDWGKRIRQQRGAITQEQLAEMLDVDQTTVSRWERGEAPPDDMKWAIAGALGTTVADLFPWPAIRPPMPAGRPEALRHLDDDEPEAVATG